jgi:hypothetical protein
MYPFALVMKKVAVCLALVFLTTWLFNQCAGLGQIDNLQAPAEASPSARSAVAACPPQLDHAAPQIALNEQPGKKMKQPDGARAFGN